MAAARAAAERAAARQARRARITELLAAEGMEQYISYCEAFIVDGEGSEEEAVERAREVHQRQQARQARRAAVTAALEAEGIQYNATIESAMYGFIQNGTGTQDAGACWPGLGVGVCSAGPAFLPASGLAGQQQGLGGYVCFLSATWEQCIRLQKLTSPPALSPVLPLAQPWRRGAGRTRWRRSGSSAGSS